MNFSVSDYKVNMQKLSSQSMLDFDNSFNVYLGIDNNIDWFDNPYILPNVYEITEKFKPQLSSTVKLRKCED